MPTFDVQTSADAYGAQQYPYLVVVDAPIVGESFAVWPAGLFNAQTDSNFVWSVGAHDQMIASSQHDSPPSKHTVRPHTTLRLKPKNPCCPVTISTWGIAHSDMC